MSWDDLEPGQDDLVKEDRTSFNLFRKAKNISLSTVSPDEQIYTDHNAGNAADLTPQAEKDRSVERRVGSPVGSSMVTKLRLGIVRVSDIFGGRANRS